MVTRFGCLKCVDEDNSYLLIELEGKGILERVCISVYASGNKGRGGEGGGGSIE